MRITTIIVATFLTWVAVDLNLAREESLSARTTMVSLEEEMREKKRRLRHRYDVIPPWARGRKLKVRSKVNHVVNRSKDPRDSDQRKIRRKFNNM